jgi:hypothetical protein
MHGLEEHVVFGAQQRPDDADAVLAVAAVGRQRRFNE